ncbi:MAG: putative DNA-binding mobile mystery protein A [Gammaproteobacteria bacterium]|jgi:predicted DNA-binding mobile mystery protein A
MSTKHIVALQYEQIVERAAKSLADIKRPREGWLRTVRNALYMSGAQLARRLGVTRSLISQSEKAELSGRITIKKMEELAEAMDCRFVYAVVPNSSVHDLIATQARRKATAAVLETSEHMALQGQALAKNQIEFEVNRLARQMAESPSRDLWDDK